MMAANTAPATMIGIRSRSWDVMAIQPSLDLAVSGVARGSISGSMVNQLQLPQAEISDFFPGSADHFR
jgi:hypothetical protein